MRPTLFAGFVTGLLVLASGFQIAHAEEIWTVRSGVTTVHLNDYILHDLGLTVTSADPTAETPSLLALMETPNWSFRIADGSNLSFRVDHGVAVAYGVGGGSIRIDGGLVLQDARTGIPWGLDGFVLTHDPGTIDGPGGPHPSDQLVLRNGSPDGPIVFYLKHPMFDFHRSERTLHIHYLNITVAEDWARSVRRPDMAGWNVGIIEVTAKAEKTSGTESDSLPATPRFAGNLDVGLGGLDEISEVAHDGVYPTGTAALSMATTACNLGDTDVPWLAPMQVNHPTIAMALYRLMNGRFEQIGVSWLKHGFYALSNSDCSQCQQQSDGTYLGIGCSDTYGVGNNSDRTYLGPRSEVNAFTAVWTCTGSHFSGGVPDCIRRHGGAGHGPLDHRLLALDADLNLPGATYFYEGYYLVRDDVRHENNLGSRICTMSWNGSVWNFTTPPNNNPLVNGPAIERFGQFQSKTSVGPQDGTVYLAVQTTSLGGGTYHYEYALFDLDSDLGVRSFTLPVGDPSHVTNIGFHDSDYDPTDDWTVTLANGQLTWQTDTYANNPNANYLGLGLMFNFRFDSDAPPSQTSAILGLFKPSTPDSMSAQTLGPEAPAGVGARGTTSVFHLYPGRPNPLGPSTVIAFDMAADAQGRLELFDPQGRRVRVLAEGRFASGSHRIAWDGTDANGQRVESGVYYYRLTAGGDTGVQSVVVVR